MQAEAIPPALEGRDVIAIAQTGTGKTLGFGLPSLTRLAKGKPGRSRMLVLAPTRELAHQVHKVLSEMGRHLGLRSVCIYGGVGYEPQTRALRRGCDIIVATPGRLIDHMDRKNVSFEKLEILVLDEADRMLDMGFLPDVRRVTRQLPEKRQTLLFSATMPAPIRELAQGLLKEPVEINVDPVSSVAERVEQRVYFVDRKSKRDLLLDVLGELGQERALVFSRTKHGANRIVKHLDRAGIRSAAIHGNKSQNARTRALEGFRSGELRVLVATDIAARGIDIEAIQYVINFDLPNIPETYVHRIGRTGRAGAAGVALSFCEEEERPYLVDIERLTQQLPDPLRAQRAEITRPVAVTPGRQPHVLQQ